MAAKRHFRVLIIRTVFFSAVLFAMVMASLPQPPEIPGQPTDKTQHIFAFAVLSLLARLSYPAARHWTLFTSLAAFGALIELVQTIPDLGRDASILDWLADCGAVAVMMGIMACLLTITSKGDVTHGDLDPGITAKSYEQSGSGDHCNNTGSDHAGGD